MDEECIYQSEQIANKLTIYSLYLCCESIYTSNTILMHKNRLVDIVQTIISGIMD